MSFVALGVGLPGMGQEKTTKAMISSGFFAVNSDYEYKGKRYNAASRMYEAWEQKKALNSLMPLTHMVMSLDTGKEYLQTNMRFLKSFVRAYPYARLLLPIITIERLQKELEEGRELFRGVSRDRQVEFMTKHYDRLFDQFDSHRLITYNPYGRPKDLSLKFSRVFGVPVRWPERYE